MTLEEILAELERRRLVGAGMNAMPGAVNPQAFPGIMGIPPAPAMPSLQDRINGMRMRNSQPGGITQPAILGVRG